jgi:hypothetical protein
LTSGQQEVLVSGLQKKPSTQWAISPNVSLGGGKGKVGAGLLSLSLFDVQGQLFIPLTLGGVALGGGLPLGLNLSTFSPTFFSTSEPLWAKDFNGRVTVAGADLTIGYGGSLACLTFWNVDHDPYWLDIGGLQYGVSGGISAGIFIGKAYPEHATRNSGCIIHSGGDPLCGGQSRRPADEGGMSYY